MQGWLRNLKNLRLPCCGSCNYKLIWVIHRLTTLVPQGIPLIGQNGKSPISGS